MNDWIILLLSFVFVFIIMGLSTLLHKTKILNDEGARKFIHIGVSNWWVFVFFFDNMWLALIAPLSFIVLNYLSYKNNLVASMERGGKGNLGTVYFPISLSILVFLAFQMNSIFQPINDLAFRYIAGIGMLVLGYGDGLAAVIGKKFGKHKLVFGKSVEGSLTMWLVSTLVATLIFVIYLPNVWFIGLIVGFLAMIIELFTPRGLDNLTIPLSISFISYFLVLAFNTTV